jgi:hypothetical protein
LESRGKREGKFSHIKWRYFVDVVGVVVMATTLYELAINVNPSPKFHQGLAVHCRLIWIMASGTLTIVIREIICKNFFQFFLVFESNLTVKRVLPTRTKVAASSECRKTQLLSEKFI